MTIHKSPREAGVERVREWRGEWYKESQEQVRAKLSDGFLCLSNNIQGLQHNFEGPLGSGVGPLHVSSSCWHPMETTQATWRSSKASCTLYWSSLLKGCFLSHEHYSPLSFCLFQPLRLSSELNSSGKYFSGPTRWSLSIFHSTKVCGASIMYRNLWYLGRRAIIYKNCNPLPWKLPPWDHCCSCP